MPRLRGPAIELPPPEGRWPFLNEHIFGDPLKGGYHEQPASEASPWSWDRVFDREAPLMLEVGFTIKKHLHDVPGTVIPWTRHN